jgi:hypoxanthine phosphoribosyltransferase
VLLVEDIIDTGLTLNYLKHLLEQRQPRSLKTVAFLDKPSRRRIEVQADYVGFTIEDKFVIGYGLDFEQKYRNLKDLCVLVP